MATSGELDGNNLLLALRPEERETLRGLVDEVQLRTAQILYEPGDVVAYTYFPRQTAVATFHVVMGDGSAVETAMVGREGAVGGIVSNGKLPSYARCCIMHGGSFFRIATADLDAVKDRSVHMRSLFARYADCMLAQVFQSVACNATHNIEQRAAKWMIAALRRTDRNEVSLTQDQLGSLLGVGRTYVSRVIRRMKEQDIIATRRGGIVVRNRRKLEATRCECMDLVEEHFETVLKGVYSEPTNGH